VKRSDRLLKLGIQRIVAVGDADERAILGGFRHIRTEPVYVRVGED
jgi:hypothetical protein